MTGMEPKDHDPADAADVTARRRPVSRTLPWSLAQRVSGVVRATGAASPSGADTNGSAQHLLELRHRAEALSRDLLAEGSPHYAPDEDAIFQLERAFSEQHRRSPQLRESRTYDEPVKRSAKD